MTFISMGYILFWLRFFFARRYVVDGLSILFHTETTPIDVVSM